VSTPPIVEVWLWDLHIASLAQSLDASQAVTFRYTDEFLSTGYEVAPILMPASRQIFTDFNQRGETFKGLPPLVIDSLPDNFGEAIINQCSESPRQLADPTLAASLLGVDWVGLDGRRRRLLPRAVSYHLQTNCAATPDLNWPQAGPQLTGKQPSSSINSDKKPVSRTATIGTILGEGVPGWLTGVSHLRARAQSSPILLR